MSGKVQVYYNTTKKCFSVKQNGKVIGYEDTILMVDADFVVNAAAQARVRLRKKKEVHALVCGTIVRDLDLRVPVNQIVYNPYLNDHFTAVKTRQRVDHRDVVKLVMENGKPKIYGAHIV